MRPLIAILFLTLTSYGAIYKDRNIDGRKYACTAKVNKTILTGSVTFDGRYATIVSDGVTHTLKLYAEVIESPHDIEGFSDAGHWTLSVDLE